MINENDYIQERDLQKLEDLENLAVRRRMTDHALNTMDLLVEIYTSIYRRYCTSLTDFESRIRWINRLAGSPFDEDSLNGLINNSLRLKWKNADCLGLRKPIFENFGRIRIIEILEIDRNEQKIMKYLYTGAEKQQRIYYRVDGAKRKRDYRARKKLEKLENEKIEAEKDQETEEK